MTLDDSMELQQRHNVNVNALMSQIQQTPAIMVEAEETKVQKNRAEALGLRLRQSQDRDRQTTTSRQGSCLEDYITDRHQQT